MKARPLKNVTFTIYYMLTSILFSVSPIFSLPYKILGDDSGINGYAPRWPVGHVDYTSDDPGGDPDLGTRITYQVAVPRNADLDMIPLVIVLHGNGGNSGSFCIGWKDQNGNSVIDRRNDPGKEYIVVGIDGHPPVGKPIDDISGNWHYHYSEYNFDVPNADDEENEMHRVDHVQGIENVIAKLVATSPIRIDTSRIYLMGSSGGGLMAHLLTMEGIGSYNFAAAGIISAALGGIKNQETSDPGDGTWDAATGGFHLGTATDYEDCETDPVCAPIPSSQIIYRWTDYLNPVPVLIQLGDSDPHFPVLGGEDTARFETAVKRPDQNSNRTAVSSLTQTITKYRVKNGVRVTNCPLDREIDRSNGLTGFKVSDYNDPATCNAIIKVVEMENWGHEKSKDSSRSDYDAVDRMLLFFETYGVDPVNGGVGGLGE